MLNKRMLNIIEYLINNEGKGVLKEMLGSIEVSERTLRYDIDKINEFLLENQSGEIIKRSKGKIELLNPHEVREYLIINFHRIFFLEYRDISILISIIFCGKVNISHICEKFDLSRPTINNDMKEIKKMLSRYNLQLIMNNKEGFLLIGKEEDIRRIQLKVLNKYFNVNGSNSLEIIYTTSLIKENLKDIQVNIANNFIDYITKSMNKVISDEAYTIIRNYIIIMVVRVRNGFLLKSSLNQKFLSTTDEFLTISKAIPVLEAGYQIKLNEFEIYKITDYFLGSHSYNPKMSFYENWIEVETNIKKIIGEVSDELQLDLSKDKLLMDGLLNHIKPAIHRVKNKIELKNSIYFEVVEEYPELFRKVKKSMILLEKFIGLPFSEDEIAYIVLHFKGAVDRNLYQKKETKDILLVCGEGLGTSKLVEQQLKENYNIDVVESIPLNQLKNFISSGKKKVDLIITTVKINQFESEIPVIHVRTILNTEELKKIDKYNLPKYNKKILLSNILNSLKKGAVIENQKIIIEELKAHLGNKLIDDIKIKELSILDLLPLNNIKLNVRADSWEGAIKKAADILFEGGYTHYGHGEEMIRLIKKHGSYIVVVPNLAIPHTNKKFVKKTGMSLITLSEPVYFPGKVPVNTILAFSSVDNKDHFSALSNFLEIVKNYDFIKKAHRASTPKKIIKIFEKYEFFINLGKNK
ncbi:BglG family transcription antiterminator [Fusobacteria bacterium ZRK30]|nr:BglG family transcription antiterminator [Fusobacteria bacterium ZRK30]